MCNCHSPRLVPVAITGCHCSRLADLAERDRPNVPPAHYLALFPTAHKSMRNCHSPVSTATAGLNAISLLPPLDVHPAHCPLLFSTAHKSMCTCLSPRLVQVDVAGLHCLCCDPAELWTHHTARCCFRQRTTPCATATATARDLSQSK